MKNDSVSVEQLWELLSAKLRSFLLQRVSDEQVADDLLQETFIRIHQKLDGIGDQQRITSWVFQIARNLSIDYYRKNGRNAVALMDEPAEFDPEDAGNLNTLVADWLPRMISELPDTYRDAVELYELKQLSQQEIADRLGVSLSGAKSRIQRGRARLKTVLFDCCSFERDRRGNVIRFVKKSATDCRACDQEECEP